MEAPSLPTPLPRRGGEGRHAVNSAHSILVKQGPRRNSANWPKNSTMLCVPGKPKGHKQHDVRALWWGRSHKAKGTSDFVMRSADQAL